MSLDRAAAAEQGEGRAGVWRPAAGEMTPNSTARVVPHTETSWPGVGVPSVPAGTAALPAAWCDSLLRLLLVSDDGD